MSRIPYPALETLSEQVRECLSRAPSLNVLRMMSHSEALLPPFQQMGRAILSQGLLADELRELVILRVAHLADSDYEKYQHIAFARHLGMEQHKIDATAIGSVSPVFDEEETALLRFVEETFTHRQVSEDIFRQAQGYFSAAQLVEISMVTGYYVMTAGFLKTFDIETESAPGLVVR